MTVIDPRNLSQCTECARDIVWALVALSGKRIPVDPEPVANGNIRLRFGRGAPTAIVDSGRSLFNPDNDDRFVSHFSTCSHASDYRKAE